MDKKFFTHSGQQQQGPFSIEELKNQTIQKSDMVWCEGMDKWQAAGEIDELKPLFPVEPPPLQNAVPPPLVITSKNETGVKPPLTADEKKRRKKLFIYIGAGAGALLLLALSIILVAALSGNKNKDVVTTQDMNAKFDSLKAITLKASQDPNGQKIGAVDDKNMTPEQKEEALKLTYKKNWKSYISARANYSSGPAGGITNATVTLSNNMPYPLEQVTIWLNYIRIDGSTYKSEKIVFYNVPANRNETKPAPWSDKGKTVNTRISKITSKSLGFSYSDI